MTVSLFPGLFLSRRILQILALSAVAAAAALAQPSVTTTLLPAGQQNSAYTATLAATGGSGTGYTWTSGTLPAGMMLSSAGVLSGTPAVSGNFSVAFTVTDSLGGAGMATLKFTIDVAGTVITTNLPAGYAIVNTSGTTYGAATYSGTNQIYWQQPFSATGGALLEYTIQPGTYTFRVMDAADAQVAFPSLTTAQLNSMYTAWTYNSPYLEATLVFDSSAVGNGNVNQLFSVAEGTGNVNTPQAAYNNAISFGVYNALYVGARNATPTYTYTFTNPATLVFAVPDNGLSDNAGGSSILIAPVAATPVSVTTTSLPGGMTGMSYGPVNLAASGGSGIYTWSATGLPTGFSLTSAGVLTGSGFAAGMYTNISFTVADSVSGMTASQNLPITIIQPLTITTTSLQAADQYSGYNQTVAANGGVPPYSWSVGSGLPPGNNQGLSIGSTTGAISGTPNATGNYSFTVTVTDSTHVSAMKGLSITVNAQLGYSASSLPAAEVGAAYSQSLVGTGGTLPYTFATNGTSIPAGLTLNASTGAVTGTPTLSGTFPETITLTDAIGVTNTVSFSFVVNAAPTITTTLLPAGQQNSAYSATLTASGGSGTGYTFTSGTLPAGMTLSSAGALSGTPTASGNYSVAFTVTDSAGSTATSTLKFTIDVAGTIITTNLPSGYVIVNTSGTTYGAAGSSGANQIYWQRPFSSTGGALLEYTLPAGTYSFRVIDPADAQTAFPSLTTAQLNSMYTAWTYNSPYTTGTLVFDSSAATNSSENQLFSVADINGLVYTAQAAYNLAISQGTYNAIAVGARNATPIYSYTFTNTTTLIFAVPDYGLGDNGGGTSLLIAPTAATPVSITTTSLPAGLTGTTYGPFTLGAQGGDGIYTWSATGLPANITLSSAGVLSGSGFAAGMYTGVMVTVTDTVSGMTAAQTFTLQINGPTLSITTNSLQAWTTTLPNTQTLTATGASGNSANYSWTATGLPSFATLSTTGVLSGTPMSVGTFPGISITVTDTVTGQTANMAYSLTVNYRSINFDYTTTINGLNPLAYFRLESTSGFAEGGTTYSYSATGATVVTGAPINNNTNKALSFNGTTGAVTTTFSGGISNAATILAWVNLSQLPSTANRILYIAGESQVGNDFDLQFSSDNYVRFYTTNSGQNIGYLPSTSTLTGQWHLVAATFDNVAGKRAIYWDGVLVATDNTQSFSGHTTAFNIAATPVFSGRNFPGSIDEVALWSVALTPTQIAEIYGLPTYTLPPGAAGEIYGPVTLYSQYGSGNITWSGNLPTGMSMSSSGTISGTPTTANSYQSGIGLRDNVLNQNDGFTFNLTINPALSIPQQTLSLTTGAAFSQAIAITGGVAPYTFTVLSGSLPPSTTLNALSGLVSGTAVNTPAASSFTIQVTDRNAVSAMQTINWAIAPPPVLMITTTSLAVGVQNDSYSQTLAASNATGSITGWTVTVGSLPPGLALSNAGALTGTLTQAGMSTFTVKVTDSANDTATQQFTLTVNPPLAIMSGSLAGGAAGESYSANLNGLASGGAGTYTWGPVLSGSLPPGVILSSTGAVSGTVPSTGGGSYTFGIKVADQNGDTATGSVTIPINGPLTVTTTTLPAGTVGTAYNFSFSTTGGSGSNNWVLASGTLPSGLSLQSAGLIGGSPTASGSSQLTFTVTDSLGGSATTQLLTLTVTASALSITTTSLTSATSGTPYNQTLAAGGGAQPYAWSIASGTFTQAGLVLNSGTGAITGTPNIVGGLSFTVQVMDHTGQTATQSYVLQIAPATPPTFDFAVENEASSIVRISDVASRDGTICSTCTGFDIAADSMGNIYSKNQQGIKMISPTGAVTTVLNYSSTDSALTNGGGVGGLALDGLGNIVFVDNSADAVYRVRTDGSQFTFVASYPVTSPNELQDTYVAVDSAGNYIVADDANGGVSVYKFTPNGRQGTSVLSMPIAGSAVSGLVIDSSGNYDFLDYQNNQIVGVTPGGSVSTVFSIPEEQLDFALGLTLDRSGNFVMGGDGFSTLFRASPAGAFTTIAGSGLLGRVSSLATIPAAAGTGPLTISPSSLPSGATNQTYSVTLAASGGSGSYTWMGSGFPGGIGISSGGTITGSTGAAGSFPVSVMATDTVTSQTGSANYLLTIVSSVPPLTISQSGGQLDTALGGSVSDSFSASGGAPPYTFSASGLPGGVTINSSTGALGGNPSQAGTFSVGVQVTDLRSGAAATSITIGVLSIGSGSLPPGVTGQQYSASIGAAGGIGSITFTSANLPAGLSLSQSGGISGIVQNSGPYSFSVKATDGSGVSAAGTFSVTFAAPGAVVVTSSSLPSGSVGAPYGQPLGAVGGSPPYRWSRSGGNLPPGMTLTSTGVVSGTPLAPGTFSFGVMATDNSGGVSTASITLTIQPAPLVITTAAPLASGITGIDYPTQVFGASGGTGSYTWSITSGALPNGITFSNSGTLSGNTTAQGAFAITVTVTDAASAKASANYSLNFRSPTGADLILSTGSVSFMVSSPATAAPAPQIIGVQSSQASTQLTYSLVVSPAAAWLNIQNGTMTPDNIQASLTSSALTMSPGTYTTTVTLTCTSSVCSGHTQTVAATLTVSNTPATLSVGTSLLSFGLASGTTPASQSITLQNSGGGSLLLGTVSCEASWCTVSGVPGSLSGGVNGTITVTVDPVAAGMGFSRTQVDIVSSGGRASVAITVLVAGMPTMTLAPVGQQYTMQTGAAGPGNPKGSFLVTVATGAPSVAWTVTATSAPSNWLVLGTTSGMSTPNQPGVVSYSIGSAASSLPPGVYYAQIVVTSLGVVDSPQVFEVVLSVTAAASAVAPDPEPGGLLFITTAAATPPQQTVAVYSGSSATLTFQASVTPVTSSVWLAVSPGIGTTSQSSPGSASVTVTPGTLAPGIYTAGVSFSLSATAVRTVFITLIVTPALGSQTPGAQVRQETSPGATPKAGSCAPTTLAPAQTGLVNHFAAAVAWPTPLSIVLADNCGSLITNGQIVATFSNGDPPLPLSLADPSKGLYSGTWTPRSAAAQVTVTARATAMGYPTATAQIVGATLPNAAPLLTPHGTLHSFDPVLGAALAPGTIVQIYGQNLASQTTQVGSPGTELEFAL